MIVNRLVFRSVVAAALFFTVSLAIAEGRQPSGTTLSPNAAAELLFQLETLQQEIQSLRGQLEEQNHELQLMKRNQRDRYIDLDKRISLVMSSSVNNPKVVSTPDSLEFQGNEVQFQEENAPLASIESDTPISIEPELAVEVAPTLVPINQLPPTEEAKQAYNDAYNLIRQRKFDESEQAFVQFVKDYPSNTLTGNGYYWLGEVKLVQGKSEEAIKAFLVVTDEIPGHSKEPDALYKLGTVTDQLGDSVKARVYLQEVIRRFPTSKAAQLAAGYLGKVK